MSYHNGSVWPHDNALAVFGMALYGLAHEALPVVRAFTRRRSGPSSSGCRSSSAGWPGSVARGSSRYPVSCSPQAWASAAFFLILQASLGLYPEAPARVLHVRNPVLPDFLDELTVHGLTVGDSRVALQFRRQGSRTLANLLEVEGGALQVRIELD